MEISVLLNEITSASNLVSGIFMRKLLLLDDVLAGVAFKSPKRTQVAHQVKVFGQEVFIWLHFCMYVVTSGLLEAFLSSCI